MKRVIFMLVVILQTIIFINPIFPVKNSLQEDDVIHIEIESSLNLTYLNEPVVTEINFSYNEAASGSLRLFDENLLEIPYQIIKAEYYPNTNFYKYVKLLFFVNFKNSIKTVYTLKYSSKPMKLPDYSIWSDLRIYEIKKGGIKNLIIENKYVKAVFQTYPPLGLCELYNLKSDSNRSIIPPFYSFASSWVIFEKAWLGTIEMKEVEINLTIKGPLMAEISITTRLPEVKVENVFRFYANSMFFDFKTIMTLMNNTNIAFIAPFSAFYYKRIFNKLIVSTGLSKDLSLIPGVMSFDHGNWSVLIGSREALYLTIPLNNVTSRLVVKTDTPDYIMFMYLVDPKTIKDRLLRLDGRVILFSKKALSLGLFENEYKRYVNPPTIEVLVPDVIFNIKGPERVNIYEIFTVIVKVAAQRDVQEIFLNISIESPYLISLTEPKYKQNLSLGDVWVTVWRFKGLAEGVYRIEFLLSTHNKTVKCSFTIEVILPLLTPTVNLVFRITDFDGEEEIGNVELNLINSIGETMNLMVNSSGYVAARVQMDNYEVLIYKDGQLIGRDFVKVFGSKNVTLKTWMYDINVVTLSVDGKPLTGIPIILKHLDNEVEYIRLSGANGLARFENLINGTYSLRAMGLNGRLIREISINIQEEEITCSITVGAWIVKVKALTADGSPIPDALIHLLDINGTEIKTVETNEEGYVTFSGLSIGNYSIRVEYSNVIVGFHRFKIPIIKDVVNIPCKVYKLEIIPTDPWGNLMKNAEITVSFRPVPYVYKVDKMIFQHPDRPASFLLPEGSTCEVKVFKGIYEGSARLTLRKSTKIIVKTFINHKMIITSILTIFFWLITFYSWRRKMRVFSIEVLKVKSMLSELENLYHKGEVEEFIYKKLKREYEDKLNRLFERRD